VPATTPKAKDTHSRRAPPGPAAQWGLNHVPGPQSPLSTGTTKITVSPRVASDMPRARRAQRASGAAGGSFPCPCLSLRRAKGRFLGCTAPAPPVRHRRPVVGYPSRGYRQYFREMPRSSRPGPPSLSPCSLPGIARGHSLGYWCLSESGSRVAPAPARDKALSVYVRQTSKYAAKR
jgi:hypothetical protein